MEATGPHPPVSPLATRLAQSGLVVPRVIKGMDIRA
jgi:hypothetical protein